MNEKLSLADKARRAAKWLKARDTTKFCPERRNGAQVGWLVQATNTGVYFERTDRELIAFCEDRGWQDDHIGDANKMVQPCADEEEALDCCARGMAQFMDEVDPDPIQLEDGCRHVNSQTPADGVEWETKTVDRTTIKVGKDWIDVCVHNAFAGGKKWGWSVDRYEQVRARGTAPTRGEARRQAVEAARALGKEGE